MSFRRLATIVAIGLAAPCVRAQCPGRWEQPPPGSPFSVVTALCALPDNRLLVGGVTGLSRTIAVLDDSGWTVLGVAIDDEPGSTEFVNAFLRMPSGDIIVGGTFSSIDGVSARNVARWDGKNWSPLGTGLARAPFPHEWPGVHALLALPNDEILAGGLFDIPGAWMNQNVARWDGGAWVSAGERISQHHYVTALLRSPAGDLFAGGTFSDAVRRYDDPDWVSIGPVAIQYVFPAIPELGAPLALLHNGNLVVGNLSAVGDLDVNGIARWDGTTWHTLGAGIGGYSEGGIFWVTALSVLPNGHLVAAGAFGRAGEAGVDSVAEWDGSAWSPLGAGITGGLAFVTAVLPNGDLWVGGNYERANGLAVPSLARWTTRPACPADYNCDSRVTTGDFFAFLPLFFDSLPQADVNGDGTVDVQDFFDFLEAFFAGCE